MSSNHGSYYQGKGAYAPRLSTGSSTASSNYAQSGHSSRSYSGKPAPVVIVHKPSGPTYDNNTSSNTGDSGYWK